MQREKKVFTLIFINDTIEKRVLLGFKTRGLGVHKWNGFGGKVEPGETVLQGALRELKEECNLSADLQHVATSIYSVEGASVDHVVHIFIGTNPKGDIKESEEMCPIKWVHYENIPFAAMWPDSRHWLPFILTNKLKPKKLECLLIKVHYTEKMMMKSIVTTFEEFDKVFSEF